MRSVVCASAGIVVLGVFFLIGTAQAADQETIIQKIKDNYQQLTSFQANMYMEGTEQGKELRGEGKIWAKEGKFRMEVETVTSGSGEEGVIEKQTIVFDNNIFWVYSQPKNELITIDLSKLTELSGLAKRQLQQLIAKLEEGVLNFFSPLEKKFKSAVMSGKERASMS